VTVCSFDLVVFESGVHDIYLLYSRQKLYGSLVSACSGPSPCSDSEILPILSNETYRLHLLASYRTHLRLLMAMWARCKTRRHHFRPIFKLAYAAAHSPRSDACAGQIGYNAFASYSASPELDLSTSGWSVAPLPRGLFLTCRPRDTADRHSRAQ
jgi:hypothetical protein